MKNLKKKFRFRIHLKSKHLLVIMTLFCGSTIVATLASGITAAPFQEAAGAIVVPFERVSLRLVYGLLILTGHLRTSEIL